ncbi:DUF3995 domain-containing protein [Spirosoma sp. KCTC 42546]|uniref:DUF3995 domain-containing protein n=1 Tax=Spirosoma sp. KCTC 42546 TaxID=2520506 RepID=UPI001158A683|nr:DUF3995 domain-containing protein [Spirosoma sp. KCTC 42546]QDK82860.1 DUF3995 domain-containing protein [Spirosoma sp. KCTC 42546]
MIPAFINFIILLVISGIHIYWGLGGNWGLRESVPERNGSKLLRPGRFITLVVAIIFGGMALFYLAKIGRLPIAGSFIPTWLNQYGLWLLAGIFLLRAIGDFRYVGFFKQIRNSRFADLDTKFYAPLCLLLSANTFLLIFSLSKL